MNHNNKRKVDVNDNLDSFSVPRVPPPALRNTNVNSRRMSLAAGTLPGHSAPVFAMPAIPTVSAVGSSSSASRRHAEEQQEQLDSVFNSYITTLASKRRVEMSAVNSRRDIAEQLSILLQESVRIKIQKEKEHTKLDELHFLLLSCHMACSFPRLLDETIMRQCVPLQAISACAQSRMNSLRCTQVKPIKDMQKFDKVGESLNELGETFCIPSEIIDNCVNTAGCLRDLEESINVVEEENKSLDQLKDTNHCLLAQNFSSTMKLS
ncbi:uncharacterized protein LOC117653589 [Thrips palmi]|uniref:Uncharacterized protein LOC117653589 n=1 Tax=Thrips palmi TaxID=161013 RepID=A0A6P9AD85_THRPL|nr:uncharacterized protein LOC117653589 [Thrips palmi]